MPLVGNRSFRRLVEHFGSPRKVLETSPAELSRSRAVSPAIADAIASHDYRAFAEQECRAVERKGIRIIDFLSREYPPLLLEIPDPPPYLYVNGDIGEYQPAIAMVGSRRATGYGIQATTRLAAELADHGVTVVSGMARGIDTAAHRGAVEAGGKSIGVLGCGIDVVYPPENRSLFEELPEHGALVSEFPMGTPPLPANFPRRNRLISGLSLGVLVVEAAEKSGSLITAQFALEQGREVFAVPGSIASGASRGANRLIKQGAKLVESVSDILEELSYCENRGRIAVRAQPALPPQEGNLCATLAEGPLQIDEIAGKAGLTVQELSVMLLRLELQGVVLQLPGKIFCLA